MGQASNEREQEQIEHIRYLWRGVEYWNSWRKENPTIRPLLDSTKLDGADLAGYDFSNAVLSASDWNSANLEGANFSGALANGVDFRNTKLHGVTFHSANLSVAQLTDLDLRDIVFENADMRLALLRGSDLSGLSLREVNLQQAKLENANLCDSNLRRADLRGATLADADLRAADLTQANLRGANLERANLSEAYLYRSDFTKANLSGATLNKAQLSKALFQETDLSGASLKDAILEGTSLLDVNLQDADISGSKVYGISAWNLNLERTKQNNLIITSNSEPTITVDNIEVAQFVYLLLNNAKIRDVINSITSKTVLILGRFTPERKAVLDALRQELRQRDYLPIVFDFDKPGSRDLTETISTLAHMARFIIADLTEAKSIPQELQMIVPNLPSVAIQPIILSSEHEYGMFEHFRRYPWVLNIFRYDNTAQLLSSLANQIIAPAERKVEELQ